MCKDGIQASVISTPKTTDPESRVASKLESLWTVIRPDQHGRQFVIAAVYRPPRRTLEALEADLGTLEAQLQYVMRHGTLRAGANHICTMQCGDGLHAAGMFRDVPNQRNGAGDCRTK